MAKVVVRVQDGASHERETSRVPRPDYGRGHPSLGGRYRLPASEWQARPNPEGLAGPEQEGSGGLRARAALRATPSDGGGDGAAADPRTHAGEAGGADVRGVH